MKNLITTFLIACLMAISVHGFGTNEHIVLAQENTITNSEAEPEPNRSNDTEPALGVACDICQVVHQYVVISPNGDLVSMNRSMLHAKLYPDPRGFIPDNALRPPTV
jgi:hypothetical protein